MPAIISVYLNLARWFAAMAVVLYHYQEKHLAPDSITKYFPPNGSAYVIIFFVISGFVISMVAEQKTFRDFFIDRCVRIYIVAIPVLLLTTVLSILLPDHLSREYDFAVRMPLANFALNAAFLGQVWSLHHLPYLDGPYWSLCYEVFYYAIFGAVFYFPRAAGWATALILCTIAGPKILSLFPCWLAGAAAYRWRRHASLNQLQAWSVAALAPIILVIIFKFGGKDLLNDLSSIPLAHDGFLRDCATALAFAIHLWAVYQIKLPWNKTVERIAALMAGMSYSLYLVHLPTLYVLAYFSGERRSLGFVLWSFPATMAICFIFSRLTESRTKAIADRMRHVFIRPPSPATSDRCRSLPDQGRA